MLLSIIIPQYKETEKQIKPLLESIDLQIGIDFNDIEVIIINDCSPIYLSKDFLDSFEHIKPIYKGLGHNVGPGLCRQQGLNIANGEYVTFCDADDIYYSVGVLSLYIDIIKTRSPQVFYTSWLEELKKPDGNFGYLQHKDDNTWMHGKIYNKQFLTDNDIRFSGELLYHEDTYFNFLVVNMTDSQKVCTSDTVTYVWKWDDNTITRKNNGAYSYESLKEWTHAIRIACRWVKNKKGSIPSESIVQSIMYLYYTITQHETDWGQKYLNDAMEELYEYIEEFREEFNSITIEKMSAIQLKERQRITAPFIETVTFYDFIDILQKRYGKKEDKGEV